jgi:hypothetical protein
MPCKRRRGNRLLEIAYIYPSSGAPQRWLRDDNRTIRGRRPIAAPIELASWLYGEAAAVFPAAAPSEVANEAGLWRALFDGRLPGLSGFLAVMQSRNPLQATGQPAHPIEI